MDKLKKILSDNSAENEIFRCNLCNKLLSVAPINHSVSLGDICGRCIDNVPEELMVEGTLQRQLLYEKIGELLEFPCSFYSNGCKEEVKWGKVREHEDHCCFKNTVCPLSQQEFVEGDEEVCIWKGQTNELLKHIKEEHENYFCSTNEICLAPECKSKMVLIEIPSGEVFLIILRYVKETYKYLFNLFADLPLYKCNKYVCELKVSDDTQTSAILLHKNELSPISRGFDVHNNLNSLEIDIYSIRNLLKKPKVDIRFNIKNKSADILELQGCDVNYSKQGISSSSELFIKELDEELTAAIKCNVCKHFIIPPIYLCTSRHICCSKCFRGSSNCEICRSTFIGTNCLMLELMSKGFNYPCENEDKGCPFKGALEKVKHHEISCPLKSGKCFFSCDWLGTIDQLKLHVLEKHDILDMNSIYKMNINTTRAFTSCYENQLFFITLAYTKQQSLNINVFNIGKEMVEYKYDLCLVGSTFIGVKMLITHLCQPILTMNIPDKFSVISIPYDCLKQFLTNTDVIRFKINVSRIKNE